jgi:hypothetical protein
MPLKIAFSDFWKGFDSHDNWFYHFLNRHFDVVLSDNPDFLIYSCYGHQYLNYNCHKVFYTSENVRPNFWECDFALTFDFLDRTNHFRLPLYGIWDGLDPNCLTLPRKAPEEVVAEKSGFCCMVVSNASCKKRIEFFKKLSKYKQIDSGGRYLNNVGGPILNKMDFIKNYKFTIAFENSSRSGYVTEKIFQPMFVNTIPVYWGSPSIGADFNVNSFVNWHDYGSDERVIERIIELDQHPESYSKMLSETWFRDNKVNQYVDESQIALFFKKIFSTTLYPISDTWKKIPAIGMRKYFSLMKKINRY